MEQEMEQVFEIKVKEKKKKLKDSEEEVNTLIFPPLSQFQSLIFW